MSFTTTAIIIIVNIISFGLFFWVYSDKTKTSILTVLAMGISAIIIFSSIMVLQEYHIRQRGLGALLYGSQILFLIEIIKYLFVFFQKDNLKSLSLKIKLNFIWYFPALLLIIAIFPLPLGYYQVLRLIIVSLSLWLAYRNYNKNTTISIIYITLSILFNPFHQFNLGKSIWIWIDIAAAIVFLIDSNSIEFFKKIFNKHQKKLYASINELAIGKSKLISIQQSLNQIRNTIHAQFKNVTSTNETIMFEHEFNSFIITGINENEVLISLAPSDNDIENFEELENNLYEDSEDPWSTNKLIFDAEVSLISKTSKNYVHIDLATSFYIMENNQVIKVDSEKKSITEIIYEIEDFKETFQLLEHLKQAPSSIVKASYSKLGFNNYLFGLGISGSTVQPLNAFPANGVYILIVNSLTFKMTLYENGSITYESILPNSKVEDDEEIPF